ncbi:MAG: peptidylprolyl isomerase [Polyangiaceae bacterium]
MLDAFRSQGLKSVVYGGIIVAIIVAFVISSPFGKGQGKTKNPLKSECAVEVRGECVSPRDYRAALSLAFPRAEEAALKQLQLRKRIADGLVERTLLAQDAERLGITVSDDDLNQDLIRGHALVSLGVETPGITMQQLRLDDERPMRVILPPRNGKEFDQKNYEKSVRLATGRGPAEFRENQKVEQIAARMRDLVRSRVRISESEAYDVFVRERSTASFKVVKLTRQWFAKNAVDVSQEGLDKFATEHKAEIDAAWEQRKSQYAGECRRARHLLIKVEEGSSDDEKVAARKRAEEAKARFPKEKFEDIAREVSEDPGSAIDGGDLGCVQKGKMVKPFEDAVFALKAGEISGIVETKFGFHVIWLESILNGEQAEALGRREIVKGMMMGVEAETKAVEAAKQIRAAVAGGKTLEAATQEVVSAIEAARAKNAEKNKKGDKKEPTKDETKPSEDPDRPVVEEKKDITADGTLLAGAATGVNPTALGFALTKPGETTPDVIKLEQGYAVITLVEKKPASRETFEKEKERFSAALLEAKRHDALVAYVNNLREAAKNEIKVDPAYTTDQAGPANDADPGDAP